MHKICTKCKIEKPLDQFYKKNKTKLHSWCKSCNAVSTIQRQRSFKRQAVEYKGGKCIDCNLIDDPRIYDFHHEDPSVKEFTISGIANTKWNDKIEQELDKCILLCSNCHRRRHFKINEKELI